MTDIHLRDKQNPNKNLLFAECDSEGGRVWFPPLAEPRLSPLEADSASNNEGSTWLSAPRFPNERGTVIRSAELSPREKVDWRSGFFSAFPLFLVFYSTHHQSCVVNIHSGQRL